MFSVLEGGYSDQLPELILAYLQGLEGLPLDVVTSGLGSEEDQVPMTGGREWEPPWGSAF
jgi:hypothetical protein